MISQSDAQEADTTPPVVNVPADMTVTTTNSSGAEVEWGSISATDEGVKMHYTALSCDFSGGNPYPVGTTTITCWATDTAGNVGTASFTITVNYTPPADTTAPTVNVPADIVVESPDGTAQEITFVAKTSTFLKLDSLAPIPKSSQISRTVDIFGQLLTIDRQSIISGAEIKLVFTGFTYAGKDHYKITTDNNGKFDWSNIIPIEEGYAIQAVYDGSSNFKSSKSKFNSKILFLLIMTF